MLFVHLTDARIVPRIRKHGLRTNGKGDRKGIFCVPLVHMEQNRWVYECLKDVQPTTIRSTALLWKFWMKKKRPRRGRPVAIIFSVPRDHWPAELTLEFTQGRGALFYDGCTKRRIDMDLPYAICPEGLKYKKEIGNGPWHLLVSGELHVKQLLREYERTGTKPLAGDLFQLMFYKPVPGRSIQRIIPLDRRTGALKERRSLNCKQKAVRCDEDLAISNRSRARIAVEPAY